MYLMANSNIFVPNGGAGGSRTPDPLLAKQVLWPTELQPQHCPCSVYAEPVPVG